MEKKTLGVILMIVGVIFSLIETAYFGWNMFPQSTGEIFCDLFALAITVYGYYTYKINK